MEEEEDATAAASPKDLAQMSPSPEVAAHWVVGARLESKSRDSSGGEQWFPAKVLEVEGDKILVHYMQWNARHDEWIPSNSPRLRAMPNSGKSSRHNSGGGISETELMTSLATMPLPAHKDFKPGEKVMATWKLNRKYLASVIRFEVSDGTYLVEFYDGVQCHVKPNNIRRPRKGEEDVESLRVNGAIDNGSAENSDNESTDMISPSQSSSSGRRERKRKFDVKQLLNIRSVKSLRGGKDHENLDNEAPTSSHKRETSKRRRSRAERCQSNHFDDSSESSGNVINGNGRAASKTAAAASKSLASLEDGPALAAVSGKRERKKKKFWDDEQEESSMNQSSGASPAAAVIVPTTLVNLNSSGKPSKDSMSSLAVSNLKRKSSGGGASGMAGPHKKVPKKSEVNNSNHSGKISEHTIIRPNGSVPESNHSSSITSGSTIEETMSGGKENGKILPYLQLDLSSDPELIAEQMVEGVNIPGMGQPIPVDSSSLPDGWEKRVIQRRIGITKGKWDVFITNPETGKSFRSKTELQKHLDERKLPYTCDAFDFSLDDNLKRLRQIWKQYKVKPFMNNPKGSGGSGNFKHVPARITQVQDADIVASRSSQSASASSSSTQASSIGIGSGMVTTNCSLPSSASASSQPNKGSHSHSLATGQSNNPGINPNINPALAGANNVQAPHHLDMACLTEIAVDSETGQGLRCSIAKCGKLFRNDRLLRQHVKHYHPKVYESVLFKHPQLGDDISEPTSPEARRLSDSSDFFHEGGNNSNNVIERRQRVPSASSDGFTKRASILQSFDTEDQLEHAKFKRGPGRPLKRSQFLDEEAPLSNIYNDQELADNSDDYVCPRRTRNDSVLSSLNSDTEGDHLSVSEHHRNSCPPTPPTFRLSKRRQAQMQRKRVQQPIVRMSKIEDTPLGRDFREEILSLQATSASASAAFGPTLSSHTTSPNNVSIIGIDAGATSSYPPSEMDASIAGSEHLTSEELVNCTCRRIEEDGLMIQCDICLCWQHGYCVGIEDEDPVPEKHVCETCRQPPGGRTEARFSLDQDWLKEGKLPSCESALEDFNKKRSWTTSQADRETAFRKLSELMADLANLEKVLQSLRLKLHVASQPNNSKVFMWSSVWSLPTHQPQFQIEDEIETEEEHQERLTMLKKEPEDDEEEEEEEDELMGCESPTIIMKAKPSANDHLSRLGSAIDPQEVAEKLSLIVAENAIKKEQESLSPSPNAEEHDLEIPKLNGLAKEDPPPQQQAPLEEERQCQSANNDDDDAFEKQPSPMSPVTSPKDKDDHDKDEAIEHSSTVQAPCAVKKAIKENSDSIHDTNDNADDCLPDESQINTSLTNGNDNVNGERREEAEDENSQKSTPVEQSITATTTTMIEKVKQNGPSESEGSNSSPAFDASFIPSVSEVERLLPSVIQEIESGKDSAASSPPTSVAPMTNGNANSSSIIPEPKRLDRDECRLNLLQHIDNVQSEIQKRFKAIESVVFKLEVSNSCSSTSDPNSKVKAKLASLIQDLSISRQLVWTL